MTTREVNGYILETGIPVPKPKHYARKENTTRVPVPWAEFRVGESILFKNITFPQAKSLNSCSRRQLVHGKKFALRKITVTESWQPADYRIWRIK